MRLAMFCSSRESLSDARAAEYLKQYEKLMMAWNLREHKVNQMETRNRREVIQEED
jgi:hypothetical protein